MKDTKTILIPITDTLPGPGAFEAKFNESEDDAIPILQTTDSIHSFGHGTAQDVSSTSKAPDRGHKR